MINIPPPLTGQTIGDADGALTAVHLWPPLTTVAPAKPAVVEAALRLLTERIQGYRGPGRHELVESRLIERRSTAR